MAWPFIVALLLALASGLMWWQSKQSQARKSRLLLVETSTTAQLKELAQAAADAAGPGAFSEQVELEGVAVAGPRGMLTSELSGTACVWHQHRVTRRYNDVYRDNDGDRRTRTKEEVVTKASTRDPFLLRDADGEITVVPTRNISGGRKVVNRYEDKPESNRTDLSFGTFSFSLPTGGGDGATLGYEYEEWVLMADTRIFVQGEATDQGGALEVREPRGAEKIVISTRSEADLIDREDDSIKKSRLLGALSAAGAVVMLVVGIVTYVV